ncbi:MAG TPA: phosphotransferase family protein [Acidimicrobiales bacterium]|nr:phosphotransferase family protein [Acidimicrobiales bacterium]
MQGLVPTLRPPLRFDVIAGGRSNVTYRMTDAHGGAWVLRRPPFGHLLATAHDMEREHRIVTALTSTEIPVAPVVGLCIDKAVNGAPFYVMQFVNGTVIRDPEEGRALAPRVRMRASQSLVDVLARIHAIDPDAVGLGDLGRKEAYVARQLKRWHTQFEASACSDVQLVHDLHTSLSEQVPPQGPAAIVHGDYRLDNCMLDQSGEVLAVLDWELCTLGDPLADVGLLLAYWSEPGDKFTALAGSPTQVEGFASRREVLDRYAEASGRDVSRIDYYTALGYWKVACIMAGIYTRRMEDSRNDGTDVETFRTQVSSMAEMAAQMLDH